MTVFNPNWQITETKFKKWERDRAAFTETKSSKISKNPFWERHRASFTETKSRQKFLNSQTRDRRERERQLREVLSLPSRRERAGTLFLQI